MLRTVSSLALIALMSGSAFASTVTCSKQPASKFASKTHLINILHKEGLKVHRIKTENGCYEIYASKILCGECKQILAPRMMEFLEKHQEKREEAKERLHEFSASRLREDLRR